MKVRAEQNLLKHGHIQTPNINIISISVNDNYRKLLVNCSQKWLQKVIAKRDWKKGLQKAIANKKWLQKEIAKSDCN